MAKIHLTEAVVTQGLHVALGGIFVLLPVAWNLHRAQLVGTLVGVAFSVIKEMWFDINFEDQESSGGYEGGAVDMAFFWVGIILGNLALLI